MLNFCSMMGYLKEDPVISIDAKGKEYTAFHLLVPKDYGRGYDVINVKAWEKIAHIACSYFAKGNVMVLKGKYTCELMKSGYFCHPYIKAQAIYFPYEVDKTTKRGTNPLADLDIEVLYERAMEDEQ